MTLGNWIAILMGAALGACTSDGDPAGTKADTGSGTQADADGSASASATASATGAGSTGATGSASGASDTSMDGPGTTGANDTTTGPGAADGPGTTDATSHASGTGTAGDAGSGSTTGGLCNGPQEPCGNDPQNSLCCEGLSCEAGGLCCIGEGGMCTTDTDCCGLAVCVGNGPARAACHA